MPKKWPNVSDEKRKQIFAFNKARAADKEAAEDMAFIAQKLAALPWGQLKKLLDDELLAVLNKYGITGE